MNYNALSVTNVTYYSFGRSGDLNKRTKKDN